MARTGSPILLIDDDPGTRELLAAPFESKGWELILARDGLESLQLAAQFPIAAILAEAVPGTPDIFDVTRQIRASSNVPIIFLTRLRSESELFRAFDAGADDYVTKPFSVGEVCARIVANLRRATQQNNSPHREDEDQYVFGSLRIDVQRRSVTVDDRSVGLTPTEFLLLLLFVRNVGRVLPHSFILQTVWGGGYLQSVEYIRTYVHRLRQKLAPASNTCFTNVSGVGYIFTGNVSGETGGFQEGKRVA